MGRRGNEPQSKRRGEGERRWRRPGEGHEEKSDGERVNGRPNRGIAKGRRAGRVRLKVRVEVSMQARTYVKMKATKAMKVVNVK